MPISKFKKVEILTNKISKNRYFGNTFTKCKFFRNIKTEYIIEPHVYYLHTQFYGNPSIFRTPIQWRRQGRAIEAMTPAFRPAGAPQVAPTSMVTFYIGDMSKK